jgi:hypothetical protein
LPQATMPRSKLCVPVNSISASLVLSATCWRIRSQRPKRSRPTATRKANQTPIGRAAFPARFCPSSALAAKAKAVPSCDLIVHLDAELQRADGVHKFSGHGVIFHRRRPAILLAQDIVQSVIVGNTDVASEAQFRRRLALSSLRSDQSAVELRASNCGTCAGICKSVCEGKLGPYSHAQPRGRKSFPGGSRRRRPNLRKLRPRSTRAVSLALAAAPACMRLRRHRWRGGIVCHAFRFAARHARHHGVTKRSRPADQSECKHHWQSNGRPQAHFTTKRLAGRKSNRASDALPPVEIQTVN